MIRRSFRFGLTLGLLGGLAFALVKMFGTRPDTQPAAVPTPTAPWPRLTADPAVPARATTGLVPDPDAPASPAHAAAFQAPAATPVVEEPTTAPVEDSVAEPAPVAAPVAKRAAPKKAAPKKAAEPAEAPKVAKAPKTAKKKPLVAPWVDPADGVCPTSHPVKGKLASKIFHLPGMLNYARTTPDRCYRDAPAAEADGLRPAKR